MQSRNNAWSALAAKLLIDERRQFGARTAYAITLFTALCHEARQRAGHGGDEERLSRLGQLVFSERHYCWRQRRADEDFTLAGTLLNNGGNCLGLTTLYCALAGCCGVPIAAILFEGHIAPCLREGTRRRVIDFVRQGSFWADSLVERQHGPLADAQLVDPSRLRAVHLSNRAAFLLVPRSEWRLARQCLDRAVDLFPDYCGARLNRAALLFEMGMAESSFAELERVFALRPKARYRAIAGELLRRARFRAAQINDHF